jgi:hypothetical protein
MVGGPSDSFNVEIKKTFYPYRKSKPDHLAPSHLLLTQLPLLTLYGFMSLKYT